MNGYIAFWKGQRTEVYANTLLEAKNKAEDVFRAQAGRRKVRPVDVTVALAEIDGKPYTHTAVD